MENRYYVYVYKDIDNNPVYVGKGTGGRYRDHIRKAKNDITKCYNKEFKVWILSYIETYGKDPICEIYKNNLSNNDALQLEETLIRLYGRIDMNTGGLFNKTYGGEKCCGRIVSQEERDLKSLWMKTNSPSLKPEVKLKLSDSAKYRLSDKTNHPMYGKSHTDESISKMIQNLPNRCGENNINNKYVYTATNGDINITTYNIREFCNDYNLRYESVNLKFHRLKSNNIEFKGWNITREFK